MTTDTDKLIQAAEAAGFRVVRFNDADAYACDDEGKDITPKLTSFRAAIIASLCGDVEPTLYTATVNGAHIIFCDAEPPDDAYDTGTLVRHYPASTVAALKAERDAALARVAELEKDAARYQKLLDLWNGRDMRELFGIEDFAALDAAPQPQQEQSK